MRRSVATLAVSILSVAFAIGMTPTIALADGNMPQMDFSNPLTGAQVVWMAVIMIVLYFLLARWALPQISSVIETRHARIAADLDTARQAKSKAERAVAELNLAIRNAREAGQSEIATAVDAAKRHARSQSAELNARLDAQIAKAEEEIGRARRQAVAALPPVARDVTASLLLRLTGEAPDVALIDRTLATILP